MIQTPTISTLFPYTTLFRSNLFRANYCPKLGEQSIDILEKVGKVIKHRACTRMPAEKREWMLQLAETVKDLRYKVSKAQSEDRKSTRLNSSHTVISYAVFCL